LNDLPGVRWSFALPQCLGCVSPVELSYSVVNELIDFSHILKSLRAQNGACPGKWKSVNSEICWYLWESSVQGSSENYEQQFFFGGIYARGGNRHLGCAKKQSEFIVAGPVPRCSAAVLLSTTSAGASGLQGSYLCRSSRQWLPCCRFKEQLLWWQPADRAPLLCCAMKARPSRGL
jgi:hypothetical protein